VAYHQFPRLSCADCEVVAKVRQVDQVMAIFTCVPRLPGAGITVVAKVRQVGQAVAIYLCSQAARSRS
jgi:hypothetical protein